MEYNAKFFDELEVKELYKILKARLDVFLIEQKIPYQDLDDLDYESLHCFYVDNGKIEGYLRAFQVESGVVKIGRVLVRKRRNGLGTRLLKNSINEIKKRFNAKKIIIDSQKNVEDFYKKNGFKTVGEDFLEEGIVHIKMEIELKNERSKI